MVPRSRPLALLAIVLPLTLVGCGDDDAGTPRSSAEVIAADLDVPWDLTFLPNGSALVTLRDSGEIVRVEDDVTTTLGTVPGVAGEGEGGLLGLAPSPDFDKDATLFVYATTEHDNRVLRLALDGDELGEPEPVLTGIPVAGHHNGGRIAFGPDGHLYVATGDAGEGANAQDPDSLGGKILRITPDGAAAPGNPDPDSPVWSSGHRNVQGLAWREDGSMWASEFGQDTWDELNRITKGANYGWPVVEGSEGNSADRDEFTDPVAQWPTADASPSGIAVDADGAIVMAALRGESLWRVPVTGTGDSAKVGTPERLLQGQYGRLRDVAAAPDGSLWVLTNNTFRGQPREGDDKILRVSPDARG